jgi:hypothetical protein
MDDIFRIDVNNIRSERQLNNDKIAFEILFNKTPYEKLSKFININALDRILNEENLTYDEFLNKCNNEFIIRAFARLISINASRQGKIDEKFIIDGINKAMTKYGFNIKSCDVNSIRFCNDGRILDSENFKKEKLDKDKDSMKSIDGIIEGKKNGYIFAKLKIGEGGHQDNVLRESISFIDWVNKFGKSENLYVVLVDGENLNKIKEYETENIWIVNHIEFQEKLMKL